MGLKEWLSPAAGIFSHKYPTALIHTSDNTAYAVPIKKPERGYFMAMIRNKPYVFWIKRRDIYSLYMAKSPRFPSYYLYTMGDAHPVNFDDVLRLGFFAKLNPGAKITPETAEIIMKKQDVARSEEAVKAPEGTEEDPEEDPDRGKYKVVGDVPPDKIAKKDMYQPEKQLDFKTPPEKKFHALKSKINKNVAKVRNECVIVDIEKYIGLNKHPDDPGRFSEAILQEFGRRELVIPPVEMTDTLNTRMTDNPGTLGYAADLKRNSQVEFDKIANPAQTANKFFLKIMLIIIGVSVVGAAIYMLATGGLGGEPIDFSQYVRPEFLTDTGLGGVIDPALDAIGNTAGRAQETIQDLTAPAQSVVVPEEAP